MKNSQELQRKLLALDGRGYASYKEIQGSYELGLFRLSIDYVQADPYAPPSRLRLAISRQDAHIPEELVNARDKRVAAADYITRMFAAAIRQYCARKGMEPQALRIDCGGQQVLERTSVHIGPQWIEARLEAELPAAGRRILGRAASAILVEALPAIAEQSLRYANIEPGKLQQHITLYQDQQHLRAALASRGLVAFIANGALLPRESGVSDKPLQQGAVPFRSPASLEIELELPHAGTRVKGMGIPRGITLIVGGGYHGKSTVLQAIELGVYNHLAGDGREYVITCPDAAKIRAEDGRSVVHTDISPFINHLPGGKSTSDFSTRNASGSTSQAANTIEALEAQSSLLLIDEDTSATNFMIRDGRMQQLIARDKEPITPYIDRIQALYAEHGVSTILIVGGCGDYLSVADRVIMLDEYVPQDITVQAKKIAALPGYEREAADARGFGRLRGRTILRGSFTASSKGKPARAKARGRHTLTYGDESIDLSGLEQLVDDSQARCLAAMLDYFAKQMPQLQPSQAQGGRLSLLAAAEQMYSRITEGGLDRLVPGAGHPGNLAFVRKQEFMAAVNRYRGLQAAIIDA